MTPQRTAPRRARRVALAIGTLLLLGYAGDAAGAAPGGAVPPPTPRAAPTCAPTSAPVVVGVDGTRSTVTVPRCGTSTGVTGHRIEALDLTGASVLTQVDVPASHPQATLASLTPGTVVRYRARALSGTDAGPAGPASNPTVQPFTSLGAFSDRQHRDLLGRAPTTAETADWSSEITAGELAPADAIADLDRSTHSQAQAPVIRLYRAYFLRLPDTAGLEYWAALYRSGRGVNTISQQFSQTPEFRTLYGSLTDRGFVELVYENVLGRPGTSADVAYWTSEITSGRRTRGRVMVGFSESPENRTRLQPTVDVVTLFTGLLRRVPTTGELATWSGRPRTELILALLDTSEYAARTRVIAPTAAVQIDRGWAHTCALLSTGIVRCWGYNNAGQVGDGTSGTAVQFERESPVTVAGITTATAIAAGGYHSCALLADTTVRCWGENDTGQLGDGTTTDRSTPVPVAGLTGVRSLSAGRFVTCAALIGGGVRCWGVGGYLGDGTTVSSSTPVAVSGITDAVEVTAGWRHVCARLAGGTVRCWGDRGSGQVGNGTTGGSVVTAPVVVTGLSGATQISGDYYHTCARLSDGTARCWGENGEGQVGTGSRGADVGTAVAVAGLGSVAQIVTGAAHTCALLGDGSVRCLGGSDQGQMGDGRTGGGLVTLSPTPPTGLGPAIGVTADGDSTCAVLSTGAPWCWGYNYAGQLGDGTSLRRPSPVAVAGL